MASQAKERGTTQSEYRILYTFLYIKQQYANSKNFQTMNNDSFTCQPSACSATSSYHYNAEM